MAAPEAVRVLFDATRLATRRGATPTGIDRVDLAYLDALSRAPGFELHLVRFGAFGPALLSDGEVRHLGARWRAPHAARGDALCRWLASAAGTPPPRLKPARRPRWAGATQALRAAFEWPRGGAALGALLAQRQPTVYLNTSHGRLYRPAVSHWLARSGVRSAFFLHDLIPIEFPEFNRAAEPARHARRVEVMARHASRLFVDSEATRGALLAYCAEHALPAPATAVLPLGVDPLSAAAGGAAEAAVPYFVVLSTIEPRKNHQLLLLLWKRLAERHGARAPRLVLVGRRGWENEAVFKLLDRMRGVSRHVVECPDLDDATLARVLRGARALLSPSLAEGFGLPVAEALALGTPVIASDIAAHREIGAGFAELLDPLDGRAWRDAIEDYAREPSPRRAAQRQRLSGFAAPSWDAHFARALPLLREAALRPEPAREVAHA